jgi:hypothetical protein
MYMRIYVMCICQAVLGRRGPKGHDGPVSRAGPCVVCLLKIFHVILHTTYYVYILHMHFQKGHDGPVSGAGTCVGRMIIAHFSVRQGRIYVYIYVYM